MVPTVGVMSQYKTVLQSLGLWLSAVRLLSQTHLLWSLDNFGEYPEEPLLYHAMVQYCTHQQGNFDEIIPLLRWGLAENLWTPGRFLLISLHNARPWVRTEVAGTCKACFGFFSILLVFCYVKSNFLHILFTHFTRWSQLQNIRRYPQCSTWSRLGVQVSILLGFLKSKSYFLVSEPQCWAMYQRTNTGYIADIYSQYKWWINDTVWAKHTHTHQH